MYTTIKISDVLKTKLEHMKMFSGESYEDVIEDLIEDRLALNPAFIREIEVVRKEVKKGNVTSLEALKKELKMNV